MDIFGLAFRIVHTLVMDQVAAAVQGEKRVVDRVCLIKSIGVTEMGDVTEYFGAAVLFAEQAFVFFIDALFLFSLLLLVLFFAFQFEIASGSILLLFKLADFLLFDLHHHFFSSLILFRKLFVS